MGRFMKELTSDIHLYTALMDKMSILAFINYELIGGGYIEEVTADSVKIQDEWNNRAFLLLDINKLRLRDRSP
ncbi:hypothetical protein ACQKLN_04085 [Paenibacillus glucanolyticus]|uniref:hypothetical protein n=1 Tax=Paenibacillus TaxID=44249 RepID=UPI0036A7CD32|nr:hypothetical protein [Cytobacillus firmus]